MDTSGGVGTPPTLGLETLAACPRAGVRPRVTDGCGIKVGNRNDKEEEDRSRRRRDPSRPGLETTAVAFECGHKTGEMGVDHEDARPGAGSFKKTGEEAGSNNEEGVGIRPDRKTT